MAPVLHWLAVGRTAKGHPTRAVEINKILAELRASGFLKASLDRAKLAGVEVAPAGFVPK